MAGPPTYYDKWYETRITLLRRKRVLEDGINVILSMEVGLLPEDVMMLEELRVQMGKPECLTHENMCCYEYAVRRLTYKYEAHKVVLSAEN